MYILKHQSTYKTFNNTPFEGLAALLQDVGHRFLVLDVDKANPPPEPGDRTKCVSSTTAVIRSCRTWGL